MRHLLSLPLLCLAATAQDANPNRFVPAASTVVMRVGAPAQWRATFEKTQIAKLFRAATLSPMVEQMEQGWQGLLGELRSTGKFDADLLEKFVSDYRGDVVFAVQFDGKKLAEAISNDEVPEVSLVISFGPDGKFDLAAMAAAVEKAIEENSDSGPPLRDLQVGDLRLRVNDDPDMQVSVPKLIDGHIVMLMGNDLEKQAAGLLAKDGRWQGGDSAGKTLSMHGKLGTLLGGFFDMLAEQADMAGAPFDVAQIFTDLGLTALDSFEMQVGADGEQLVADYELTLNDKEPGLFGMVMFDQGTPRLLRHVPPGTENFGISPFDIGALYRTAQKIWNGLGDAAPMAFGDFEAMFTEEMKVRLKEDLIDQIGTEMLSITDVAASVAASANADEDNPAAMLSGQMMGVALRDGKKFGESLEKALRSRGMHAARKTEEYQNQQVHRLRLAGLLEVEYCVTDDMLLLAIGGDEASRRNLRAVLDQRASGAAAEMPPKFAAALERMPKGWSAIGATQVSGIFAALDGVMQQAAATGAMPPEMSMVMDVLKGVGSDLRRLGLDTMIQTTHASKRKLTTHLRW